MTGVQTCALPIWRIEARGNTQGLFHITKDAAIDVARKVLSDEELENRLSSLTDNQFRTLLLRNKELEDKLGGGYLKLAYDKAKNDPIKTYGYYNAGIYNKQFNAEQLQNQRNFKQRYEDSFNYLTPPSKSEQRPTPKQSPSSPKQPTSSSNKKFKDTYSALGKEKSLIFPSSYEPEDEEDDSAPLASSMEDEEQPSIASTEEPEEDEEENDESFYPQQKNKFSKLRKTIS